MIDPPDAAVAFTHAGLMWVQFEGHQFFLKDATSVQLDALRASRSRNLAVQAAKKALRASALLSELQLDLNALPLSTAPQQVPSLPSDKVQAKPPSGSLAIVPFIRTVKPETEIPPTSGLSAHPWPSVPFSLSTWYRKAWSRGVRVFSLMPLALMYIALIYSVLGFAYLSAHPELLVQAAFGVLDLVPNYAAFATEAMWTQVKIELAARFR